MPNLATALRSEVIRLARKEIRAETIGMRKAVTAYRSEISDLKKRVRQLERQVVQAGKAAQVMPNTSGRPEVNEGEGAGLRFRASGMAANRKRLGLSATDFGRLVGASGQSINSWEAGKSKPRAQHLAEIAALRGVGKREVARRLAVLG